MDQCTFMPNRKPLDTTEIKRADKKQINSFWERNMAFLDKREKKAQQIDEYLSRGHSFKPVLCEKSRKLSAQNRDGSKSIMNRSKRGLETERSRSRDGSLVTPVLSSTVLTGRVQTSTSQSNILRPSGKKMSTKDRNNGLNGPISSRSNRGDSRNRSNMISGAASSHKSSHGRHDLQNSFTKDNSNKQRNINVTNQAQVKPFSTKPNQVRRGTDLTFGIMRSKDDSLDNTINN